MDGERRILVTGAGGFIGGRVAESIFLSRFGVARAGIRRWSSAARLCRFPIEIALCDLSEPSQLESAVGGMTAVVHCAYSDDRESIVEGTRRLLEASLRSRVGRFVFLSTAEVYGPDARGPVDETHPRRTSGRVYSDAKIEAEALCLEFGRRGLPVSILRPSLVYGPLGQSWTVRVASRLKSGSWGTFDQYGGGCCNLVYVDDLVRAVFACIESERAAGEAFNVNGPDRITWNEYFERFNACLGLPPLARISVRNSWFKSMLRDRAQAVARAAVKRCRGVVSRVNRRGGLGSRLIGHVKRSLHTTPSRRELCTLYNRQAVYTTTKIESLLNFQPRFDLEEGLRLSTLWLAHHGLVDADRITVGGDLGAASPGNFLQSA